MTAHQGLTYVGESPRPSVTFENLAEGIFAATTPWGSQDAAHLFNDTVKDFLAVALGDHEATSPFPRMPNLSSGENNLRSAMLLANNAIYQKFNKDTYTSSLELLFMHFHKSEVIMAQVGQPHVCLLRNGRLYPIQMASDLGLDFRSSIPLPSRLMGLEKVWDIDIKTFRLSVGDKLLLLARSLVPPTFFSEALTGKSTDEILRALYNLAVADDKKIPFWVSLIG